MGSLGAMKAGSSDRYFQESMEAESGANRNGGSSPSSCPRASKAWSPTRAACEALVLQLTGGLRSGMGLSGCRTIDELRTKAKFVRITAAGLKESHAHDVIITKEAPNYRGGDA